MTVGSVIAGGVVAYYDLKQATKTAHEHLERIDTILVKGTAKREADHDTLMELRADISIIKAILETQKRASLD